MTTLAALFGAQALVPDAIDQATADALRAHLEQRGYRRFTLLDRGSYEYVEDLGERPELAALAARASALVGRTLAVASARALRLHPGDYLLAHHDAVHDEVPVEVVLDLSTAPVANAEVHYRRRGQVVFRMPCAPRSLAVVERGPTVTRNHAYVSKLQTGVVVRLVVLLRELRSDT